MKLDFAKVRVIMRRLRLIRVDRDLWVFLVFLCVSVVFWFLQTLKEDMGASLNYKLKITDIPRNVIITSDVPNEIKVNFSGHGWNILQTLVRNEEHNLEVSFKDVNNSNGIITIEPSMFQRIMSKKLPKSLRFTSTQPNRLELFYSNGQHKRVPVVYSGNIKPSESRVHCGTWFSPDSVDVYAPEQMLLKIANVSIKKQDLIDIQDTVHSKMPLDVPNGVKVLPDSVNVTVCVDLFTDKTVEVPIYSENTPANTIIRTFPQKVKVTSFVSSAQYDKISENDFIVVIDHKNLDPKTGKVKLLLRQSPDDVRNVRLSPESVEYVLETESE